MENRFPTRFRNAEPAYRIFGEQSHRLAEAILRGDPLADAVAAEIRADPKARARFDRALDQGIEAVENPGPALVALFASVDAVPGWVDFDRMDDGAATYVRDGEDTYLALLASLVAGYRSGDASKALTMSRRFIEYAPRRAEETMIWMLSVVKQGGMRRFGDGFRMTMRVRLVHAFVRAACLNSPAWRFDDWGMPVNQFDLGRGICGEFTTVAFDARRKLGYSFTDDQVAAMLHLWRYVGHVLGLEPWLQPATIWQAEQMAAFADLTATSIDDDSRQLANAVINIEPTRLRAQGKHVQAWIIEHITHGYMRRFAGEEIADLYGLRNTPFKYLCALRRPFIRRAHLRQIGAKDWDPKRFATRFIEQSLAQHVKTVTSVADMEEAGRETAKARRQAQAA